MQMDAAQAERIWTGGHLLIFALIQLLLVYVSLRIDRQKGSPLFSTHSWGILFGVLFGAFLFVYYPNLTSDSGLNPQVFYFGFLPPILLEQGFNTRRKGFFSNFLTILVLAIVGTIVTALVTGWVLMSLGSIGVFSAKNRLSASELMLFGSLVSAIDPIATLVVLNKNQVPSLLHHLIFGESVLNDSVSIVLFNLFQKLVLKGYPAASAGSTAVDEVDLTFRILMKLLAELVAIGVGSVVLAGLVNLTSAFLLKQYSSVLKQYPMYEICIVLLSAYCSFVAAEFFQLSGILAVFFSGVLIRHYHLYNISKTSSSTLIHMLTTLAFLAENFIYIYLGLSLVAYRDLFVWDWRFLIASFFSCVVARACNTFPLCSLVNLKRGPASRISLKYMVVIWFAGLRGAIAFALALNVETRHRRHTAMILTSTLFIVVMTTVLFSMGTTPLLRALGLTGTAEPTTTTSPPPPTEVSPLMGFDRHKTNRFHKTWMEFDERHLKPIFGGQPRDRRDSRYCHVVS